MKVGIGILGGGTVGGALLQYLINEQKAIVAKTGLELVVRKVAVRTPAKTSRMGLKFVTASYPAMIIAARITIAPHMP